MNRPFHTYRWLLTGAFAVLLAAGAAAPVAAQGRLSGVVVDQDEAPVADALVSISMSGQRAVEATTDDEGRFVFIGLSSGTWSVSVEKEGFVPASLEHSVSQGRNPPANFMLMRALSGREATLLAAGGGTLDPADVEALTAADTAFNADDFDAAIAGYQALLAKLPEASAPLELRLGDAYQATDDHENALAAYERALVAAPGNADIEAQIARTKLMLGDLDAAAGLEAVASGANASREDLYNLGEVEFAKGNVDAAAGWYEKAAAADPAWGKPWFKLALVALNKGDLEAAKAHFQKTIDLEPNSEEAAQAQATLQALQ